MFLVATLQTVNQTSCPLVTQLCNKTAIKPKLSANYDNYTNELHVEVRIPHNSTNNYFPLLSFSRSDYYHSNFNDKYDFQDFVYKYPNSSRGEDLSYYCSLNSDFRYKTNKFWNTSIDSCSYITYRTSVNVLNEEYLFNSSQNTTHFNFRTKLYVKTQNKNITVETAAFDISLDSELTAVSDSSIFTIPAYNVRGFTTASPQVYIQPHRLSLVFALEQPVHVKQVITPSDGAIWYYNRPVDMLCNQYDNDTVIQLQNAGFGRNAQQVTVQYQRVDCDNGLVQDKYQAVSIDLVENITVSVQGSLDQSYNFTTILPHNDTHFQIRQDDWEITQIKCGNSTMKKTASYLNIEQCNTVQLQLKKGKQSAVSDITLNFNHARLNNITAGYTKYQGSPTEVLNDGDVCDIALDNAFLESYLKYCKLTLDKDVCNITDIPDDPTNQTNSTGNANQTNQTNGTNNSSGQTNGTNTGDDNTTQEEECTGKDCGGDGINDIGVGSMAILGLLGLGLLI